MQHTLLISGKPKEIEVLFKDIKSVRLKIFPNGRICLSVPIGTPDTWIVDFLQSKLPWIEEKSKAFEETKSIEKEEHICSGGSIRILGRQYIIKLEEAKQKRIFIEDDKLFLQTTCLGNQDDIDSQFNNWWQKTAKAYFVSVVNAMYPIIKKHGVDMPDVYVKKMTTLWGSCSRASRKISLNFYLYKAPMPCIEYVILHELAHFLYPKHNRDFYDFLTIYMPDWKERKNILDYEIVLGI